ncbi:hypothetical protein A4G20_03865 [Pasteurellaceae bacterium RH1A]|nr:hypothetical protein A4G20_03865 [Pasteurellaceae bacterium RH1A]
MKFVKKTVLVTTTLAAALLAGCQASTSNTISFNTPAPNVMFNTANQTATVNVAAYDLRPSTEIANYTKNGEAIRLNAQPAVTQLFQQVMQQNLNGKGFTLVQGPANANVAVNVKTFFADVTQGNLRYKINANVGIEVVVQGSRGTYSKNFNTTRGYEGAFGAGNEEIQNVLGQAYADAVQAIYQDNEIANAIHQYK